LQDNFILWGISAGAFLGLLNFYLLSLFIKKVLSEKKQIWQILFVVIFIFKILFIGLLMAVLLVFTRIHWVGLVISINFILILIIFECFIYNRNINSEEEK